jgi:hypothetical protein
LDYYLISFTEGVKVLVLIHELLAIPMFVDDAHAHGAVPSGVVFPVHPDEVVGSVVELVAVQMMAYIVFGRAFAPESGADEQVDVAVEIGDFDNRIDATSLVVLLGRTEIRFALATFGIADVSFFIREINFAVDE